MASPTLSSESGVSESGGSGRRFSYHLLLDAMTELDDIHELLPMPDSDQYGIDSRG